jgi:hypothetical protein
MKKKCNKRTFLFNDESVLAERKKNGTKKEIQRELGLTSPSRDLP